MIDNKQIGMDINIIQQLHNRTHIKNTYLRLAKSEEHSTSLRHIERPGGLPAQVQISLAYCIPRIN